MTALKEGNNYLIDTDFILGLHNINSLKTYAGYIMDYVFNKDVKLFASSIIFIDLIQVYIDREELKREEAIRRLEILKEITDDLDLKIIPLSFNIIIKDLQYRKMFEFEPTKRKTGIDRNDSFHVATAKIYNLEFITSDKFIRKHQDSLGIKVINLKNIKNPIDASKDQLSIVKALYRQI